MKKNKVLLISVGNFFEGDAVSALNLPLGVIYLETYLSSRGYAVTMLDVTAQNKSAFFARLKTELEEAALVGLSVMTPLASAGLQITKFIKNLHPLLPIVWGGFHATLFPESTLQCKDIDFVITGEGEQGLLGLAEHLFQGKDIAVVANLVYKSNGKILKNPPQQPEDLRNIGIPSYESIDFSPYIGIGTFSPAISFPVLTSRGCPARCNFCVNSIIYGSRWRVEPLEQTLKNIDTVLDRYHPGHICFVDEFFFADLKRIQALAPELAKRNITWDANCRVDYIQENRINDEMLKMLYGSGCRGFRFGMESGSQRILDLLNKQITPEHSFNAIKKITRFNMNAMCSFMMGIPDEKPEDIIKTLDLILKIHKINPKIDIIGPQLFRPYPGSVLFNSCVKKGLVEPASLEEWSTFFMPDFPIFGKTLLPWLSETGIYRKVDIWRRYLDKEYLPLWFRHGMLGFHVRTNCRFIMIDYVIFKIISVLSGKSRGL